MNEKQQDCTNQPRMTVVLQIAFAKLSGQATKHGDHAD
jgi:hypothetical protein